MEIRGIEVTNQLRSAIRAKLLELGVRYDEELPDYILVMVVNKKTRQQMHEDLHLFLEDSTTPFVEWLHDQVLKKLQKVTVAKKKTTREFVPTVVVKQEEERKKRKNNALENLEETNAAGQEKILGVATKEEKSPEKIGEKLVEKVGEKIGEKSTEKGEKSMEKMSEKLVEKIWEKSTEKTIEKPAEKIEKPVPEVSTIIQIRSRSPEKIGSASELGENRLRSGKRGLESAPETSETKRPKIQESSRIQKPREEEEIEEEFEDEDADKSDGRLKSCVNRPKVTSVVSVKTRLGATSGARKKFEIHRNRFGDSARGNQRPNNFVQQSRGNFSRSLHEDRNDFSRSRAIGAGSRNRAPVKGAEAPRNRQFFDRSEEKRLGQKIEAKTIVNVKDRLGTSKIGPVPSPGGAAPKKSPNDVKNRLGPLKNRQRTVAHRSELLAIDRAPKILQDDDDADDDLDLEPSPSQTTALKSRIIAVNRPDLTDLQKNDEIDKNSTIDELEAAKTIASKVIVTPRPLKPLQPAQKRATQSLLLRAVAEANQSVVKQKNPEPVLTEKPRLKRLRPTGNRDIGKNLSVHLNATKRLVMEKIQVQLSTAENDEDAEVKKYTSHPVNDEHIGVVMSLFQRSNDNQKFLVTLNGYNNNVIKEKNTVEDEDEEEVEVDEEGLEMEMIDEEEMVEDSQTQNDPETMTSPNPSPTIETIQENEISEKVITMDENNENENIENVETSEEPTERKKRKLSPIVYTRSRSQSPKISHILPVSILSKETFEKRPITDISQPNSDKSRDKCRYWPNCTLGNKCAFFHPGVPCSAFPACKYGEKCAYKHPKCKFGVSCTKLGCAFSHPKKQCKYHPFCTKPSCPFSHPVVIAPVETTRAKFTWKRRD